MNLVVQDGCQRYAGGGHRKGKVFLSREQGVAEEILWTMYRLLFGDWWLIIWEGEQRELGEGKRYDGYAKGIHVSGRKRRFICIEM